MTNNSASQLGSPSPAPIPDRKRPAWLLSVGCHLLLFLLFLISVNWLPRGGAEVENRAGGIVLVNLQAEATEYLTEGEVLESDEAVSVQSSPATAISNERPPDLPGLESSLSPIHGSGQDSLDGLPGADTLLDGPAPNRTIGGKVTTEVFGLKGTGTKFVYVFDRSRSMEGYEARPLMAARQALLQSLESLTDGHQFQIIFYNQSTTEFTPDRYGKLHTADEKTKEAARDFVNSVQGDGGTDHVNALKKAFALRPDVIFFLTDAEGGFTRAELRELSQLNRSSAVINAIEFGEGRGSDRTLEQLTRENGGQYLFKDIRSLR